MSIAATPKVPGMEGATIFQYPIFADFYTTYEPTYGFFLDAVIYPMDYATYAGGTIS